MEKLHHKLLIVEDDAVLSGALTEKFSTSGFEVLTAEDGQAGMDTALAEKPDVLLLDIMLPKIDGLAVMRSVRKAAEWGRTVPIIILSSSSADERVIESVVRDRATCYLVKTDWTLDEVAAKVFEVLARRTSVLSP